MKRSDVFEVHEPEPHGWTRLKARLEERRRARWPFVLAPALAMLLCVVVWARVQPPAVDPALQELALARLQGVSPGGEPVTVTDPSLGAVMRVPTADPHVIMYRVALLDSSEAPALR